MANEEHLARLKQGVAAWNQWRTAHPEIRPDLHRASFDRASRWRTYYTTTHITGEHLSGVDLSKADLSEASLICADLSGADLTEAYGHDAALSHADLFGARLVKTCFSNANLFGANLTRADLTGADLTKADLREAHLIGANLAKANLSGANLAEADLSRANLTEANLSGADLIESHCLGANLSKAGLVGARLMMTNLEGANLTGCFVYGISAWDVNLVKAQQSDLVITIPDEPVITVDNLEVAQFIYLLLHNEKIREAIDTIGKKGVLILGRFAGERKVVLDALRTALRQRDFLPMVFDFDKPTQRDFTETIMVLAGLSLFVIADITNPRSAPLELQATVPDYMIPFVPIIAEGEPPFSMFIDLQRKYDWVLDVLEYDSIDHLLAGLQEAVIAPALQKHEALVERRARAVGIRHIHQYLPHGNTSP